MQSQALTFPQLVALVLTVALTAVGFAGAAIYTTDPGQSVIVSPPSPVQTTPAVPAPPAPDLPDNPFIGVFTGEDDAGVPGTIVIEADGITIIDDSDGNALTFAYTIHGDTLSFDSPGGQMDIVIAGDGIVVSSESGIGGTFIRQ